jgi:phage-related minor tail protein
MDGFRVVGDLIGTAFGLVADAISATWGFVKDLFSAILSNTAVMDGFKTVIGLIGTAFGIFRDAVKTAWEVVQGFFDWVQNNPVAQVIGGLGDAITNAGGAKPVAFNPYGPTRASGGPVSGGVGYLIGERGPELFVPGTSGSIVPNGALGGAGGPVTLNVTVSGAALFDPYGSAAQQIADALLPGVRRALTRNGMSLA